MQRADLLLVNANVLTMDIRSPRSDSVAIKDGVIVAVGASATAELAGERVIDCGGLALIPGFHDAHCHLLAYASNLVGVDCSPGAVSSIAEIQEALRRRAQESPPDTWIRAWGYNEFYLAEGRHPSRWDLDAATPHHPVRLMHRSGHACVLNSRAMELAGISIETSDPPGGLIDRALPSGEPTGLLYEMEDFVGCSVPPLSQGELRQGVELASRNLISWGVTSVQDASPHNTLEDWSVMSGLRKDMLFTPRVTMMIAPEALESFLDDGLSYGKERDGLRVGAMKVVIDRTRGNLYPPLDDLKEQVAKAHSAGFQVALHAVEEETVEAAIQALRYARDSGPRRNQRHRIEHCSVCPPWLAQRIKEAGVMVVTQPAFVHYSGDRYLETVEQEKHRWLYPVASLRKAGIRCAASSDFPVAPPNPLVGVYAAVTRAIQDGRVLNPEEGITPLRALAMYTRDAAYSAFQERTLGTITLGKRADLALLSGDPTKVPHPQIREIKATMTIIGGKVVWEEG